MSISSFLCPNLDNDSEIVVCTLKRGDMPPCSFPLRISQLISRTVHFIPGNYTQDAGEKSGPTKTAIPLTSAVFHLSALFGEAGCILGLNVTSILHTVRITDISSG